MECWRYFGHESEKLRRCHNTSRLCGIQLGRRFRALKLWMIVRYFGTDGLQNLIREHIRLAQQFVSWVEESAAFELAEHVLNLDHWLAAQRGFLPERWDGGAL